MGDPKLCRWLWLLRYVLVVGLLQIIYSKKQDYTSIVNLNFAVQVYHYLNNDVFQIRINIDLSFYITNSIEIIYFSTLKVS